MANREILISKERVYLNKDKTKAVGADSPERAFLLVGKGGEIERSVAEFYGLETEKAIAVSVVTPQVENAYNEMKENRKLKPEDSIRADVVKSVDERNLRLGAGVSMQTSLLSEGIINKTKADADATPGVDHTTPQTAAGAKTLSDNKHDDNPDNDGETGQASTHTSNKRSKTLNNSATMAGEVVGEPKTTPPGDNPADLTKETLQELEKSE